MSAEAAIPDPAAIHPLPHAARVVFLKSVVRAEGVEIGDYSYYDDPVAPERFYERNVLHHYPAVYGDRLVIGRFAAIAAGVKILMNGGTHAMGGFSTFPFNIFGGGWEDGFDPATWAAEYRGDTVIGSDVWIGTEAVILPGVRIGDGAIIGARAVVAADVPPYAVVVGNPARVVRQRFAADVVAELLSLAWWNWPIAAITAHRQAIAGADMAALRQARKELS